MSSTGGLYRILWDQVSPQHIEGINNGQYAIFNGVLRNKAGNHEIVRHMPFEPISLAGETVKAGNLLEISKGIQTAQTVTMGAVAVSTVAIMGAVVVATAYLAHKIEKLHKAVEAVQKEIQDQNIVFYTDKIANYFGSIEALREIMVTPELVEENKDLLLMKISDLGTQRCQLCSFLDSILFISDGFSPENKAIALDFTNMAIDLLPKGVFVESQAAYKVERFRLGETIRKGTQVKYSQLMDNYRSWGNDRIRSIVTGKVGAGEQVLMDKLEDVKTVLHSEENQLLLEYSI